ncbi:MAG: methionyl-tRNA formyltransferase [Firmicutes bacterium]|nr:methionyl-tRNA formyltransferase [Bacillota bacterium]
MRIVFMGTPAFAVPSLLALLDGGHDVVSAVTQPDRPSGRGNKLTACPVKAAAVLRGVPVLQFERVRRRESVAALRALSPDLFVTAAFGQILSESVLAIPPLGTVNVHASLLPAYRGPAPINWCLIEGAAMTGVTTMMTDAGIDTGDILLRREIAIEPAETAGSLTERLALAGADLLAETLEKLARGSLSRVPQDHAKATRHPMLAKEHGRIDWTRSAVNIANLVRGVDPWPGAWTTLPAGGALKVWRASAREGHGAPGEVMYADGKRGMAVACGEGLLAITELQAPGARRMAAADYLRGHPMRAGDMLGVEAH